LKGFAYEQHKIKLQIENVITFSILSMGSVLSAAALRYLGAADQKSTIRCIDERASKILMGNEMCEIERPLSKFTASCFATLGSTPFC